MKKCLVCRVPIAPGRSWDVCSNKCQGQALDDYIRMRAKIERLIEEESGKDGDSVLLGKLTNLLEAGY